MKFKYFIAVVCALVAVEVCVCQNVSDNGGQSGTGSATQTSTYQEPEKSSLQKGMEPIFKLCHNFLQWVMPSNFYDANTPFNINQLIQVVNTTDFGYIQKNWQDVVKTFGGVAACIIMGLIFIVFMPIVGLIYCCCHCCCNRCGGTKEEYDPPHAGCKRWTLVILVAAFSTMILVGGIIMFVGGELLHRSLTTNNNTSMLGRLDSSLEGVKSFVNQTTEDLVQEAQKKVVEEGLNKVLPTITDAANKTVDEIKRSINATSLLEQAKNVGLAAQKAKDNLNNLTSALTNLTQLEAVVKATLANATQTMSSVCNGSECPKIPEFKSNFSVLDTFASQIGNISEAQNITEFVDEAANEFNNVSTDVLKNIQGQINDATERLKEINSTIDTSVKKITEQVDLNETLSNAQNKIRNMKDEIKLVGDIIWYVCIGLGCAVLLVVAFVYLGLLFGLCGERPGDRANCCNRGSAANLLCTSICCIFLFAWILMLVVLVLFALGGLSYLMACRYINNGVENVHNFERVLADGFNMNVSKTFNVTNLTIAGMFSACKENEPIYRAFRLQDIVDFDKIVNMSDIIAQVRNMTLGSGDSIPNITLLSPKLQSQLEQFSHAQLENMNFTEYQAQIALPSLDNANLTKIIEDIRNTSNHAQDTTNKTKLNNTANALESLMKNELLHMEEEKVHLQTVIKKIETDNKADTISSSVQILIKGIKDSQDHFNSNKTHIVNQNLNTAVEKMIELINNTVENAKSSVTNKIGKCRPLYDAAQGVVDAACVITLDPFNCIWFGLGWSLFFYIPTFICAAVLAGMYKRRRPYEKQLAFDDVASAPYNGYSGGHEERMQLTNMGPGVENGRKSGMDNAGYQGTDPYYRDNYHAPSGPTSQYAQPYAHKEAYGSEHPPMYDQAMSESMAGDKR